MLKSDWQGAGAEGRCRLAPAAASPSKRAGRAVPLHDKRVPPRVARHADAAVHVYALKPGWEGVGGWVRGGGRSSRCTAHDAHQPLPTGGSGSVPAGVRSVAPRN